MQNASTLPDHHPHHCPWWLGWALASPLRRLLEKPRALLEPLIEQGHRVLEIGPGMGFFTQTLAELVGNEGCVYCVDIEVRMLQNLRARLARRGLDHRAKTIVCSETDLGVSELQGSMDVAVLIHVLHEMQSPKAALHSVAQTLRPNGKLLLVEPPGHVSDRLFNSELALAAESGFVPVPSECNKRALCRLLTLAGPST